MATLGIPDEDLPEVGRRAVYLLQTSVSDMKALSKRDDDKASEMCMHTIALLSYILGIPAESDQFLIESYELFDGMYRDGRKEMTSKIAAKN